MDWVTGLRKCGLDRYDGCDFTKLDWLKTHRSAGWIWMTSCVYIMPLFSFITFLSCLK